jgi:hypothetical protein
MFGGAWGYLKTDRKLSAHDSCCSFFPRWREGVRTVQVSRREVRAKRSLALPGDAVLHSSRRRGAHKLIILLC